MKKSRSREKKTEQPPERKTMQNGNADKQQTVSNAAFDFAYDMALRDATLRAASTGIPLDELRKVPDARTVVKGHIEWLLEEVRTNYSEVFLVTAKDLEEAFHDNSVPPNHFTFGNAQKVISMTAKYLYVGAQYSPDMRSRFSVCHCPMDSVMIEFVASFLNSGSISTLEPNEKETLTEFKNAYMRSISRGVNKGKLIWDGPSWSTMTSDDENKYKHFQAVIRIIGRHRTPQLSPLEVDLVNWKPGE